MQVYLKTTSVLVIKTVWSVFKFGVYLLALEVPATKIVEFASSVDSDGWLMMSRLT